MVLLAINFATYIDTYDAPPNITIFKGFRCRTMSIHPNLFGMPLIEQPTFVIKWIRSRHGFYKLKTH